MKDISLVDQYKTIEGPILLKEFRILEGANYFSHRPVVLLEIDLGDYDEVFTNQIPGFFEKLTTLLPSLEEHHCSEGVRGGFYKRMQDGTLLGHVIEHVAIELQLLVDMPVAFGKTRSTLSKGVYTVIYEFRDEVVGILAGKGAVSMINSILKRENFSLEDFLHFLKNIRDQRWLGPTTESIAREAEKRKIPWFRLDEFNFIQLGTGKFSKRLRASLTENISALTTDIIKDRYATLRLLSQHALPILSVTDFIDPSKKYLVAPRFRDKSNEVYLIDKNSTLELPENWLLFEIDEPIFYRMLVIHNRVEAVAELIPPFVVGDGQHTIEELILLKYGEHLSQAMPFVEKQLSFYHLTFDHVLEKDRQCWLNACPNRKYGAIAKAQVNPHYEWKTIASRVAQLLKMDVVGIDIMAKHIEKEPSEGDGIFQVVASPDFSIHLYPDEGMSRNVSHVLLQYLFPANNPVEVPLIAVGGSENQARFIELIYPVLLKYYPHLAFYDGVSLKVGDRIYPAYPSDKAENVKSLLLDPHADAILVKIPDELIVKKGLPYTQAEIGIVLNTLPEKASTLGFHRPCDYAYAQGVVLEEISSDGYIIVDAQNPFLEDLLSQACTRRVLFSNSYVSSDERKNEFSYVMVDGQELVFVEGKEHARLLCLIEDLPASWLDQNQQPFDYVLAAFSFAMIYEKKFADFFETWKKHHNIR